MIPAEFDYHAPASLDEAITLLNQHRDSAKILSGGQSLLPVLKMRLGTVAQLIDIGRIPGLEPSSDERVDYVLHLASLASPKDYLRYPIQTL